MNKIVKSEKTHPGSWDTWSDSPLKATAKEMAILQVGKEKAAEI